ncbi:enoyl-CoA hydratase/isomerase family protein [Pseudonocardia endophytica]|uniref:Enoyl-CoA hydratase/carnithine racemase n=1 Tax=Pseudonocardia endophytica TaxID=401976 RepID=A0A4R1HMB2_PSEEN|nr:enoyl-CoA hydratase/isomerase family protein [Pseudonocardia endophytica]TCK22173.1 enoyl-CoA hydratase/carnithine racemase [Pseudonocardia endophytica]
MTVTLDVTDRVARITLDRPAKRNAVTGRMWTTLRRHLDALEDRDVVAVVLGGAGGSFSAGADLDELRIPDPEHVGGIQELAESTVLRLRDLAPPTLAVVDGPCLGAGASLALACDLRICTPRSRFAIPSLRHGIVYEPVHVQRLLQVVRPGSAALLLYGGETWDGDAAARHGLVDRCTDDLQAAVEPILAGLRTAPRHAVLATAATLRAGG